MNIKVLVVLGQTSTGKSDIAVSLAQKFNGEVISADSRQIYIGMNIGTGKITKEEMQGITHHLLDIKNPNEDFSVEEFQRLCQKTIQEILNRGKLPIVCGGTGYYIKALVENTMFESIPKNLDFRKELEEKSLKELQTILEIIPKEDSARIDTENKRRLIRAIEIGSHLGIITGPKIQPNPFEFLCIGLQLPDDVLKEKINTRLKKRLEAGMIQEVQKIHSEDISWQRLESFGLEYKYCAEFLQNKIQSESDFQNILEEKSWQYAKRQKTWFQKQKNIDWFNPDQFDDIKNCVSEYLQKKT